MFRKILGQTWLNQLKSRLLERNKIQKVNKKDSTKKVALNKCSLVMPAV